MFLPVAHLPLFWIVDYVNFGQQISVMCEIFFKNAVFNNIVLQGSKHEWWVGFGYA